MARVDNTCGFQPPNALTGDWECALSALTLAEPGRLEIVASDGIPLTWGCGRHFQILLLGDGTAVYDNLSNGGVDSPFVPEPLRRVTVQPPEYFEECAASGDDLAIGQCLHHWFIDGECLPEACCPTPGSSLPACE